MQQLTAEELYPVADVLKPRKLLLKSRGWAATRGRHSPRAVWTPTHDPSQADCEMSGDGGNGRENVAHDTTARAAPI